MKRLLILVAVLGAMFVWLVGGQPAGAHQPDFHADCNGGYAQAYIYPAGSTFTLTLDGVVQAWPQNGYKSWTWTPTVNHTATFVIVSSDGLGNQNYSYHGENCVPVTTTTVKPTTTTGASTSTSTSSSTTTTTQPTTTSTSTPPSTTSSTTTLPSPTTSVEQSSSTSVTPSTDPSPTTSLCYASSTNSDISPSSVVTSSPCETPSSGSTTAGPGGTSASPTSSTSGSQPLPATGAREVVTTVVIAAFLVLVGLILLRGGKIAAWWKAREDA